MGYSRGEIAAMTGESCRSVDRQLAPARHRLRDAANEWESARARFLTLPASADRNRSPIVTVPTPRGRVDVMHQEMRGLRKGSGWRTFWLARRAGKQD
jgi:hypothetical protein